jgi:hypothetical protein
MLDDGHHRRVIRRKRCRTHEWNLETRPSSGFGDFRRVGGENDAIEDAGFASGPGRVLEQRVTRKRTHVLTGYALGSTASRNQTEHLRWLSTHA